jgi:sugar phosphate isomerase/epimerase
VTQLRRRSFLASVTSGLAAPALLRAQSRSKRYPIAFSTLGCPTWSWKTILENADRLGYTGVEIRGISGEMDLPKVPEFQGTRLAEAKKDLAALGLVVTDLGSGARMHEKDPATREKHLDEGRRFIDLAQAMGAPYVRVFPDKLPPGEAKSDVIARVVDGCRRLSAYAKPAGVTVLLETHGDFATSADFEAIVTDAASDHVALLWDAHHTYVTGREPPADSYRRLGRFVRHVHLKDSVPEGDKRRYVLVGAGEVPVREQVKVLAGAGYKGYYSFEWEKGWHPEIEGPEVAFPHYAKTVGEYLAEAGVKAS